MIDFLQNIDRDTLMNGAFVIAVLVMGFLEVISWKRPKE